MTVWTISRRTACIPTAVRKDTFLVIKVTLIKQRKNDMWYTLKISTNKIRIGVKGYINDIDTL